MRAEPLDLPTSTPRQPALVRPLRTTDPYLEISVDRNRKIGGLPPPAHDLNLSRNTVAEGTECGPRRTLAEDGHDVSAVPVSIWELIADVPAPGSDHRQHEPAAFREQDPVEVRVPCAGLVWNVGYVKLDRPTAARLEVDEQ